MTEHPVTLEQLEQLDAAIAEKSDRVVCLAAELARVRQRLDVLRADQARMIAEYNRQAARPLAEWDGRGVIRRRPS